MTSLHDTLAISPLKVLHRDTPAGPVAYTPDAGVTEFAARFARATPMEAVEFERKGVTPRYVKDLAKHLGLPATRMYGIIDMPRATATKKQTIDTPVKGRSSQPALALTKLVALANKIVSDSTDPKAKGFDASKWLGAWIERPQAALGGRKPADLLDTPTGAAIVARLLGAISSGAYQ